MKIIHFPRVFIMMGLLFGLTISFLPTIYAKSELTNVHMQVIQPVLELIGHVDVPASDISVMGDYAYVATTGVGVSPVDISTPETPILYDPYSLPNCQILSVFADSGYIYTTWGEVSAFCRPQPTNAFQIIDATSPPILQTAGEPYLIGGPGAAFESVVSGSYAYIVNAHGGLLIFDISSHSTPQLLSQFTPGGDFRDIDIEGNLAYLAGLGDGVWILDVSDSYAPSLVKQITFDNGANTLGIKIKDNFAYVANGIELRVINISDPQNPVVYQPYLIDSAWDVEVSGNCAFVARGDTGGLKVIDISNPSNLHEIASYDKQGRALRVTVSGNPREQQGEKLEDYVPSFRPFRRSVRRAPLIPQARAWLQGCTRRPGEIAKSRFSICTAAPF